MNGRPAVGVVFDCNILLQAVARKTGPAAACLRLAEEGFVHLHLSEEILIRNTRLKASQTEAKKVNAEF